MGFLDRLLGRSTGREARPRSTLHRLCGPLRGELTDEQALERYRYLVGTARPS
jgi:hypothetical protein